MPDFPFRGTLPFFLLSAAILAGHVLAMAAWDGWIAVAALFGLLAGCAAACRFPVPVRAAAVAAFCGALAAGRTGYVDPEAVSRLLDREAVLRGSVRSVRQGESGWAGTAEDAELSTPDRSVVLRLKRVAVSIRNPAGSGSFPAELRATGRLHPFRGAGNPMEIPREWEALASGIQYAFSADASDAILLPPSGGVPLLASARERIDRWLVRVAGDTEGGLYLRSLATGRVPPASHPLSGLFRRTGLAHLFAISGVNVAVFFALHSLGVRGLAWLFRRRSGSPDLGRIAAFASLPACWGYVLMAGAPIPAVRSAGMITAAVLLWRCLGIRDAASGFSLLFLLSLAANPFPILSPSFLLSYGAVFFLIAAAGGGRAAPPDASGGESRRRKALRYAAAAAEAAAVAFFGTLPVSAAYFQGLPAGSILWNVLFGPLLGTGGVAGVALAVAGGAFGISALEAPVRLASRALSGAIGLLRLLSGDGAGYLPLPPAGPAAMAVATLLAAAGTLFLRSRGRKGWPAPVAVGIAFLAWIHLPFVGMPDARMSLTALDVGKGASHVLGFPGGGTAVIDCGSALRGDAGRRVLLPFLRSRGISRIELLVLSHPHEDHYGGAAALLEAMPVDEVWIPGSCTAGRFGRVLDGYRGRIRRAAPGDEYRRGHAGLAVRSAGSAGKGGANSESLVIEARCGRFSAWLPGDVESGPSAWGRAAGKGAEWRVLFLPHHGSSGADPAGWLSAARPDAAVVQNKICLVPGNLITSVRFFALENGALTLLTDGVSVAAGQEAGCLLWRYFCRIA
jgi:competence protein ComEC